MIFQPSPEQDDRIDADHSRRPWLEVYQQGDIRWLGFGGATVQSAMSMTRPERLVLPYTEAMLLAMPFGPQPRRLLNLGLGGGSFNRFFAARCPQLEVISVERDARVVDVARRWFMLDADHHCVVDSARRHLERDDSEYDLIFCDLHAGAGFPEELLDDGFYRLCRTRMDSDATLVINTLPDSEAELLRQIHALRESFASLALVEVADHRNILLFAAAGAIPADEILASGMRDLEQRWDLELACHFDTMRIVNGSV